eukprot:18970-Amphidinium_carterae.1
MPPKVVADEDLSGISDPSATASVGSRRPEASAPPEARSAGKMRITLWSQPDSADGRRQWHRAWPGWPNAQGN